MASSDSTVPSNSIPFCAVESSIVHVVALRSSLEVSFQRLLAGSPIRNWA
ncbi:hypothetical protein EV192_104148 [Actinocrispum wychmicini]|uniref:Uncharacterized protein n=1 Tax=Actinocrispum wychmicini TaxID=1213861 RepID=A0A4R2JKG7_9PSEU|nr:hypothetical protein EV192_104148 [Actinocrispum wychmicini]